MRKIISAVMALGLVASSAAYAADSSNTAPLSPGKPAGVKHAELASSGMLIAIGIGVAAIVAGVVAAQSSSQQGFVGTANPTGTSP